MCAIVGALLHKIDSEEKAVLARTYLDHIITHSKARGRDGFGWAMNHRSKGRIYFSSTVIPGNCNLHERDFPDFTSKLPDDGAFVCNLRAEPTTEYVIRKLASDQQPYRLEPWTVVHNGTIANDAELRTGKLLTSIDSAAIPETLYGITDDLYGGPAGAFSTFVQAVQLLVGSYAILASHEEYPDSMLVAANYRPVWYAETDIGVFFASSADYFPDNMVPVMLEPYSAAKFRYERTGLEIHTRTLRPAITDRRPRALVVASGGMDSTVAATDCIHKGMDVELIHFTYGCRAQEHELEAINAIAEKLNVPLTLYPMDIYNPGDSRLFDQDSDIAGGEAGAEYAHEWVPARNLVMLSLTTAMAEAKGFDYIVLGNNLEEAGAYPDNEPEFIRKFNQLLPFAVGDGKRVEVLMPVGDLMKHEVVRLGVELGAPLNLTWSCYKKGGLHCGKCGPCFMRRTAFDINNIDEVISYEE